MSDTVIKIENLSKLYRLGVVSTGTLRHDLSRFLCRIRGKEDPYLKVGEMNVRSTKGDSDYVLALKDINLEVKRGERVGIIGKNGAGKSTLLKILSQVTGPTQGKVKMKGRVGSLLEVGTGFHTELTGRENIYMNGTILGMTRREVSKKLDEIVDFAGVERYLDTPVKRYSSGMLVRLGFAVAAHLEPDILIVDEVLAVGDAEFQKKAIGKMQEVSESHGRTILFVSHNMGAIVNLCNAGALINDGEISFLGSSSECVNRYIGNSHSEVLIALKTRTDRKGTGIVRFTNVKCYDAKNKQVNEIEAGVPTFFEFDVECVEGENVIDIEDIVLRFSIVDTKSYCLAHCSNIISGDKLKLTKDKATFTCSFDKMCLNKGRYYCSIYIGSINAPFDYLVDGFSFNVFGGSFYSTGRLPEESHSSFLIDYKWRIK